VHPSFITAPTEESLGVSLPAGAIYSTELTAFYSGYSTQGDPRFVFEIESDLVSVERFFEEQTGRRAIPSPDTELVAKLPLAGNDYVMLQGSRDSSSVMIIICKPRDAPRPR